MFTTVDKALVALIGVILFALNTYFGVELDLPTNLVNAIVGILTPILTWAIPNKARTLK